MQTLFIALSSVIVSSLTALLLSLWERLPEGLSIVLVAVIGLSLALLFLEILRVCWGHIYQTLKNRKSKWTQKCFHFLMIAAMVLMCSGCMSTSITELTKALAGDTNSVSVSIRTIYGTVEYQRNTLGRVAQ